MLALGIGAFFAAVAAVIAEILLCLLIALVIVLLFMLIVYIAKAIYDYATAPTIDDVWDEAVPDTPAIPAPPPTLPLPPNGLEKVDPKVLQRTLEILGIIAATQELKKGDHNVYDVHVFDNSSPFMNYAPDRLVNGKVATSVKLPIGDIYKYGLTEKNSVKERFGAAFNSRYDQTKASNQRDRYIYNCLKEGKLSPTEWYLYHYAYAIAYAFENILITGYTTLNGMHPAGNMNDH